MNALSNTEKKNRLRTRGLRIAVAATLLISTLALATDADVRHAVSESAKQLGTGHWSEAANSYVTCFNYLFRPKTGAGARLNIQLD